MQHTQYAKPLLCDYLKRRETPLKIDVLKGSIDSPDENLENTDAVLAIEIIEHLYPDILENVPYNIFGFIEPKVAIFTTPNSDINVLFDLQLPNGFRHYDHKFEWNRKQFKDWCLNICKRFPNYLVSINGIGPGPPENKQLGKVTQSAVFIRKDMIKFDLVQELCVINANITTTNDYEVIFSVSYPFEIDSRSKKEKIYDEAKYVINRESNKEIYMDHEKGILTIPIKYIFREIQEMTNSIEELKQILVERKSKEFEIKDNSVIMEIDDYHERYYDDIGELIYGPNDDCANYVEENDDNQNAVVEYEDSECWD